MQELFPTFFGLFDANKIQISIILILISLRHVYAKILTHYCLMLMAFDQFIFIDLKRLYLDMESEIMCVCVCVVQNPLTFELYYYIIKLEKLIIK